ncbi:hypothetical protein ESCCO14588_3895 [Escherichia coli O157:H7 str. TW14588]|nr:hypothetical protein ESCCO14588_3895 [Escherichia coli O157:H7 str. TW14588]
MLPELLYHIFFYTPIRIKGRIGLLKTAEIAHHYAGEFRVFTSRRRFDAQKR